MSVILAHPIHILRATFLQRTQTAGLISVLESQAFVIFLLLCFFMVELIMSFPGSILIFSLISQV
jgi:hypothetical protein